MDISVLAVLHHGFKLVSIHQLGLPLITKTIIFVGSCYTALFRIYREPTKTTVLVVEGRVDVGANG